ncbi:hypothetical protein [Hymenobacter rubidus]|uniref:hypothetical protein n=1 Tax=Hymenobacter rubidus TaxID=1441626 RepID=UPI00191DD0C3|nr:hypothetical protein [Hymenobacter rubidus]
MWVVLIGAHGLALGWALHASSWSFPDTDRYLKAAENWRLYRELYARTWPALWPLGQAVQEFTIRPPGYPWTIWALDHVGQRPVPLLIVQNLLSLLNLGLVLSWWGQRARPTRGEWMLALSGFLSFPAQLIYANAVMSEVLLQTLVVALAWLALLFLRRQRTKYFAGVAAVAAAALLLKPVFFPLSLVIAGIGIGLAVRFRRVNLGMVGLVPMLVAGLYMGWNERRTGYFHFSSIAEINLLHYNAAGVIRQLEGPKAEETWVAGVLQQANAAPSFAARQQTIQARAGAVLRAHPMVYARQHAQGMAALFLDPGRFDIGTFLQLAPPQGGGLLAQVRVGGLWRAVEQLPLGLLALLGTVLAANIVRVLLAIRGFWRLRNAASVLRYGRWVAAGLLLYIALLTGPLGAARFLVPVWPLLLALALVGLPRKGRLIETSAADASE